MNLDSQNSVFVFGVDAIRQPGMPVPKATVDEDARLDPGKNQVGCAWEVFPMEPEAIAEAMCYGTDKKLRKRSTKDSVNLISHSQITSTSNPTASSSLIFFLSRSTLREILRFQY